MPSHSYYRKYHLASPLYFITSLFPEDFCKYTWQEVHWFSWTVAGLFQQTQTTKQSFCSFFLSLVLQNPRVTGTSVNQLSLTKEMYFEALQTVSPGYNSPREMPHGGHPNSLLSICSSQAARPHAPTTKKWSCLVIRHLGSIECLPAPRGKVNTL